MEATKEQEGAADLLHHILPPRLEDAGLEDCALPPDSIKEAFLKAATAVKSRATSIITSDEETQDDDCVIDPWTAAEDRSDAVVGAGTEVRPSGPCGGEKGVWVGVGGDEVVVSGEEEKRDKVIVGGEDVREEGGDRACVDGFVGLEIGENKKNKVKNGGGDEEDDEEEKDGEGPILVGGFV